MTTWNETHGIDSMNKNLVAAEYAVRGKIVARGAEIEKELAKNPDSHPFDEVIACNIGNPQALLQKPITYYRQVASLVNYPWLLNDENVCKSFPADVLKRAKKMLEGVGHYNKTGAYTHSQGYEWIRTNLAAALEKRDGVPAHPEDIFLTDGASPGIKVVLNCLITNPKDGVLIPLPQYPLYSATLTTLNGASIPYYLNEDKSWKASIADLQDSVKKAIESGIKPRALVVINPGNPTGQVLTKDEIFDMCKFADENSLMVLADEVYQNNIYVDDMEFVSFKEVTAKHFPNLPLVSFHSVSKGVIAECGKRGGYMEVCNVHPEVKDLILKLQSISLCPNINGQILVDLMMTAPDEKDESFELFNSEVSELKESLKRRARSITEGINAIPGISTQPVTGSMYAFPKLELPQKAIDAAKEQNLAPDAFWCLQLLENTGVIVVPGSGFGQAEGTYHFRTTILPPEELLEKVVSRMAAFQKSFLEKYS
eukprot:TRINITY_DN2320_c0_g1_i3.p1 TRINITY_DN2320_c0_g1~~TRINITY_DN2320_c0_g1_i3.p1  ORF type:complete len:502 (+),score=110.06 TRINITY_DN2320_c0_g1_i3:59-1507(+)